MPHSDGLALMCRPGGGAADQHFSHGWRIDKQEVADVRCTGNISPALIDDVSMCKIKTQRPGWAESALACHGTSQHQWRKLTLHAMTSLPILSSQSPCSCLAFRLAASRTWPHIVLACLSWQRTSTSIFRQALYCLLRAAPVTARTVRHSGVLSCSVIELSLRARARQKASSASGPSSCPGSACGPFCPSCATAVKSPVSIMSPSENAHGSPCQETDHGCVSVRIHQRCQSDRLKGEVSVKCNSQVRQSRH